MQGIIDKIADINTVVNDFVWGVPAMICIIGVGIYLSVLTGFIQVRKFPYAINTAWGQSPKKLHILWFL